MTFPGLRTLALAALAACSFAPMAAAQDISAFGKAAAKSNAPIKVTADSFDIQQSRNMAVFSGHAVVVQGTFRLTAPKINVSYGPGGTSDLKMLTATGGVTMTVPGETAVGDTARYDPKTAILTLSGHVRVTNKQGTVSGPELVVDRKTGNAKFTSSGKSRVTAVFSPNK